MNNIDTYVSEKLKAGADIDAMRQTLLVVGWKEDTVSAAIAKALVAQGVPSPEGAREGEVHRASAVEVIVNFFSFVLLAVVAFALGALYFGVIDRYFPDPLQSIYDNSGTSAAIHYAIAALVVAFPLYVAAVRLWFRRFREDKEKEESKLSKWLTYIVLLATALTIVGDLITVIFNFLQGELTLKFFLKAFTILTIAGVIFGFYFLERKKIQYKKDIPRQLFLNFGYAISVIAIFGVILGFFAAGTPQVARDRQLDLQRSDDLRSLASCISSFAQTSGKLPDSLAELDQSSMYSYCASNRRDPVTREEYQYRIVEEPAPIATLKDAKEAKFELCANFTTSVTDTKVASPATYALGMTDKWVVHDAGLSCDTETVVIRDTLNATSAPVILK